MRREDELSNIIIGAAIEVHKILGPGLLESAYEKEIQPQRHRVHKEFWSTYKQLNTLCSLCLCGEESSVDKIEPIHDAQVLTYLKLSKLWLGLIINFNVPVLKDGIKRIVN